MLIGLLVAVVVLALISVALSVILVRRSGKADQGVVEALRTFGEAITRTEGGVKDELSRTRSEQIQAFQGIRQELSNSLMTGIGSINGSLATAGEASSSQSKALREEVHGMVKSLGDTLTGQVATLSTTNTTMMTTQALKVDQLIGVMREGLEKVKAGLEDRLSKFQQASTEEAQKSRQEVGDTLRGFSETMHRQFGDITLALGNQFKSFSEQIMALTSKNEEKMEAIRLGVDSRLGQIQEDNGKRLEEMRQTVDEKLHATLESRLGDSFKLVSERLEQVHQGLGEMKTLGAGVGDLKKVLSNVKTRGILGEVLLGNLLEQILSPEQYESNVAVRKGSAERVEFAVKFPGQDDGRSQIYLPIDSKMPMEDFERLQNAYEVGDKEQVDIQLKQLETRIKLMGKSIRDKYIFVPETTDFAILFLPTEALFAEVLRIPGLHEYLQRECKVTVCGPTNLAGFLMSLSMGFRTLAIAKRSSEVWNTLGVVKTEFGKFSKLLEGVKDKLIEATNKMDSAAIRSRSIERKLREVEAMPLPEGSSEGGLLEAMPGMLSHLPEDPEVN